MQQRPRLVTVDHVWSGRWSGRTVLRLDGHGVAAVGGDEARAALAGPLPHVPGTVLAPFTDSHVHLGLVDATRLPAGGISKVVDLGWDPAVAVTWLDRGGQGDAGPATPDDRASSDRASWPEVRSALGLVTAPGGYPARSGWAPPAAALAVRGLTARGRVRHAERLVARLHAQGASLVKVALHSDVGPVLDDALLDAVVRAAHDHGLPVTVHAQGPGQVLRALDAGVDQFAHAPFDEVLPDDVLARAAATTSWVSTLDIHGRGAGGATHDTAVANVTGFRASGGRVLYGTDLGNGDLPLGVHERELLALGEAGLGFAALLGALAPDAVHAGGSTAGPSGLDDAPGPGAHAVRLPEHRVTHVPDVPAASGTPAERAAWLARARAVTADELAALAGPPRPAPHDTPSRGGTP